MVSLKDYRHAYGVDNKDSSHLRPVQSIHQRTGGWKSIVDRLKGPCYLSRDDHDHKIRARKQRTDIGKYSFVNRIIKLWNQLPAEAPATFPSKLNIFRKRVRK